MFDFIRKLFKALNSSGKSWQLSGAIVLAIFSGFLPTNSLILFDLLFLALVLNLNFGLFLLFTVIFSGVGYLFDPLFESLGYAVLTNEGLKGFFTTLYNSMLFRWSGFNYTLVTGSLIVSAILALPAFFILNKFIALYRVQLGEKLNEWKLTKWMKLFNEEAKSTSVFRWWGVGVFGGLAAAIILFMVLLFDPIVKFTLEKSLSYALQTQVTIKEFSTSLSKLSVEVSGIEVADKDKLSHNLVQAEKIAFDLGFTALLEKKVMIDLLDVRALAFDIKRGRPAEAYESRLDKPDEVHKDVEKKDSSTQEISTTFALPDVDDILAKEELTSVKEAQRLRSDISATQEKWKKISAELKAANEIDTIKSDAKKLESSLKGADIQKIASAAKDIDALKMKISSLKNKYGTLQKEFDADQRRLRSQITQLKDLPSKDISRLKKKYSLDATGGANLISILVDKEVGTYMKTALKYYAMIQPYINEDDEVVAEEAKPPRGEGRWIRYANHSKVPELLIKEAKINIKLKHDEVNVMIKDLCSNQKLYGKAMILHADAKGTEYKDILADIIDDRRQEKEKIDFNIRLSGFQKDTYTMEVVEMRDILVDGRLKGTVTDGLILAKSDILVQKVQLQIPSRKILDELVSSISKFKVTVGLKGEVKKPAITVVSDLDKQLSSGLKLIASREVKKFEEELGSGVLKKAGASSEGLNAELGDTGDLLSSKQNALSQIKLDFASTSNPLKGILPF